MVSNEIKISTVRGAGLAFPVACLWFVFSGQPAVFGLVLCGAVIGFAAGVFGHKHPVPSSRGTLSIPRPSTALSGVGKWMKLLTHPNPAVRFGSLLTLGVPLFLLAWGVGYFLLPEGLLRGEAAAHMVRSQLTGASGSVFEEWVRILRANLFSVAILLGGSLLIRVNGLSFGYLVVLVNMLRYGLYLGTNSFAIPYAERLAPSFEILSRGGPYEMLALVLFASTSCLWSFFEVKRIFMTGPERVTGRPRFSWQDAVGLGLGLILLAFANWIEARMVMGV